MIEFEITEEAIARAEQLDQAVGVQAGSITHGQKQFHGFLGRVIMDHKFPKASAVSDIRVRTTNVKPKESYLCGFFKSDLKTVLKHKYIIFVRVKNDLSKGWILGWMPTKEFISDSKKFKKGDREPYSNFFFKSDSLAMPISKLRPCKKQV